MSQNVIPRHQQKIMTDDTIAIRKLREIRRLTRAQAGIRMTLSSKQIEAIENGRVQLTEARIDDFCAAYSVSRTTYELIKSGKASGLPDAKANEPKLKIIEHKNLRRNYKKLIDRRVRAIISLRHLSGLSQNNASYKCGYARCQFGQVENGRIEISEKRIRHIVSRLGFTMDDYQRELAGEKTSYEMREECEVILKGLSIEQLQTIHPLLKSLEVASKLKKAS